MIEYQRSAFAGFWNRFFALVIDVVVVAILVFPFAVIIGLMAPKQILVEVPFNLFTTTTTVSEDTEKKESIERDDVLGTWAYYYKITEEVDDFDDPVSVRTLIDSQTKQEVKKTTSSDIEFYILFIYWILLEASIWQASLGKKIVGLQVVNESGERLSLYQSAARNLSKVISVFTIFIGFMMAGWTNKKQTLHDMITNTLVVKTAHNKSLHTENNASESV